MDGTGGCISGEYRIVDPVSWKKKKKQKIEIQWGSEPHTIGKDSYDQEMFSCENIFGSAIRYMDSDDFRRAHLENTFGSLTVYFDNAIIQGESAHVDIENTFGETVLYIPKEWKTVIQMEHAFGSVQEHGKPVGSSQATLFLCGETNFGAVEIHYV